MSKWIGETNGKYITTLADKDGCKYCYNEVCCNYKSEHLADFVSLEYGCRECELIEKEDLELI